MSTKFARHLLASTLLASAFFVSFPVFACSYEDPGEAGWWVVEESAAAAPDLPLIVRADGRKGRFSEYRTLDPTVTVTDENGAPRAGETRELTDENLGRIVWAPSTPFQLGERFNLEITGVMDGPVQLEFEVREFEYPEFPERDAEPHEDQRVVEMACCMAADPDASACIPDSCDSHRWGEPCRACRVLQYESLVAFHASREQLKGPFQYHFDHRVYRVGDEEHVELKPSLSFNRYAVNSLESDRCFVEEVFPVVGDSLESRLSDPFCINPEDVQPVGLPNADDDFEPGYCEPGTRETGIYRDGFEREASSSSPDSGGCSSTRGAPAWLLVVVVAIGLRLTRRRFRCLRGGRRPSG